jgi:hypothetical protein
MDRVKVTLESLNTETITVEDRDGSTRFLIEIDNHLTARCLTLSVKAWDGDNYGTPNEKHKDVSVSYNRKDDRE